MIPPRLETPDLTSANIEKITALFPPRTTEALDENIGEKAVTVIAQKKPLRVVFWDSGFTSDPAKVNVLEIFKRYAPDTQVRVI
jgi:adenine-specific DNA-methyltransferase